MSFPWGSKREQSAALRPPELSCTPPSRKVPAPHSLRERRTQPLDDLL